ncbi:membrane protein [Metschnikowia bicuspidata var. bicuspidata NRRL YB-4993]|uniref:Very-long-chain (3R)-3-hydroxyacyl-CoA dehydratase n=1 Tax=Metschnikowia bicuspidata var. bicuspidata NRRL YB-4993 TaxID=869754 RepID=A0A1A0HAR0_9ASCO|nr:membrane protein [Metschnikowia bicuspidata var. bicuspidata NRRL YB-4993]OBA21080.1 membrane protein [Metschnikowia bicuspidata var. bicuspidata NRRL YB-4993]
MLSLYLKTYNVLSALAWAVILFKDIIDRIPGQLYHVGYSAFPHKLLTEVQTANAIFEIAHALVGIVPSPLGSLLLQFFARLVITLGISYYVPASPGNYSMAYSALVAAWSITEIIRYSFYAAKQNRHVPRVLLWLRYLSFIVLYPLGLLSEPVVVYKTLGHVSGGYYYFLALGMLMYVPGFVFLYLYMWKQRKKYLVAKSE